MSDYPKGAPAPRPPATLVGGRMPLLDARAFLAGEPGAAEALAAELRWSLQEIGFFMLRGHGVPQALIDAAFAAAAEFHAQPLETKLRIKVNERNVGYLPMGGSITKSSKVSTNTKPNLNQAFFARRERTPDDPDVVANKPFRGMNQWPDWMPQFRDTALAYMDSLEQLGRRMVPAYTLALGLPADHFDAAFARLNMTLRMSHYPAVAAMEENQFSLAPHTDSGFMTLLAPNPIPGLNVRMPDGTWFDVPHIEGAFIVNSGDMLHRWTNEVFLSTPHRVVNRSGEERYAIPYFFDPHPDTMIACLPSCTGADLPPKHEALLFDDYIQWFARRNYLHLQKKEAAEA